MSKALIKKHPLDIDIGGFRLTAVGLVGEFGAPPSIDEFRNAAALIGRTGAASNWWIGDLANHAKAWGDEYVQLLNQVTMDEKHLSRCSCVASGVQLSHRCENLPWTHHYAVYQLTPKDQKHWLRKAQPKEGETAPRLSVAELKAGIRDARKAKAREDHPLPTGTYRVLLADPPWQYGDDLGDEKLEPGHSYGPARDHYPSLSTEEICSYSDDAGKGFGDLAWDDSVLFLWATSPMLPDALRVMESWGFDYKSSFVWDKVAHNFGHYNSVRHELLLIGTKGSCLPDSDELQDSVISLERSDTHSQKPEAFYELIESMYSEGPYIECFARSKRDGWDSWGNKA